jgi:hypothetical protein
MGFSRFINILLFILLLVIAYILYYVFKAKQSIVSQNYLGNGLIPVPMSQLTNFSSNTYFYEIWIYVNSVSKAGNLPSAANTNPYGNIFYVTNNISLDVYKNTSLNVNINKSSSYDTYTITDSLQLQRWQQIIISVNNNLMDLYLNGKLVKSIQLQSINIPTKNANINFGKSDIYISKFNRLSSVMNTQTAWNRYIEGNAGLVPVHANVTLTSNGSATSKYDLF